MTMRYALPAMLIALAGLAAPGAEAQRAQCRDCDTTRAAAGPGPDQVLAEQLARLSAEIQRLRSELARTSAADSSSARALRTTISSLVMSQRHLEEAMREHETAVRLRRTRELGERTGFIATPLRASASTRPGYVGLTTEARYTLRESAGGRVRQFVEYPVIVTVEPGSPAFRAGLAAGDTVISVGEVDGRKLEQELASMLRPGETLYFRVRRGDDLRVVPVRVEAARFGTVRARGNTVVATGRIGGGDVERAAVERTAQPSVSVGRPAPAVGAVMVPLEAGTTGNAPVMIVREPLAIAGARLAPMQHDLAAKLGVEHGLYVLTVAPETPSARAGLEAGDVIVGTLSGALTSLAQLHAQFLTSDSRTLTLRIVRDGEPRTVTLRW